MQSILDAPAGSDDALARDLGLLARHLLARSNRGVFAAFDELALSFSQAKMVMSFMGREAPCSVKALADEHGLSLPAASRAVDGLLKRGLVTRTEHPDDRRQVLVAVTESGAATVRETRRRRDAWLARRLAALTPAERDVLARAAEILRRIADS